MAVVGASGRSDSLGEWSLVNLIKGGFRGNIYPVNPGYDELQGYRCYASLSDVPEVPELVIFAVGDPRLEAALEEAIALQVPAAVIMSTLFLDDDATPPLRERVQSMIDDSRTIVCGANGMGFFNVRDHVWACGFDSRMHDAPGNVSLISHSGSGMCGIIDCERRLQINVAVSTGNELAVTMDEYLDFVLDLPETRVVGLFIETARNPAGLVASLEKAAAREIPIVALKVGRTEQAARLAVSHSGAMAGDDATYEALFDRYGVQRVRDMDEFATALIMFAEMNPVADGGLVSLHDSGGERQLMVDLADEFGVPLARMSEKTTSAIAKVIDPELPAVNPLDGWSRGGPDSRQQMISALTLMLQDDQAAIGAAILDRGPDGTVYDGYLDYLRHARQETGKPVALVASRQGTGDDEIAVQATREGFPVVDGVSQFLRSVSALFGYRDFLARGDDPPIPVDEEIIDRWRDRLGKQNVLSEYEALRMLSDFDIPVVVSKPAQTASEALDAATELGFPVVLKTATDGIRHKTDQGGVILGIQDASGLREAYAELENTLGPSVLVAQQAKAGVEMFLGARRDPQFGPVVLVGFGGVYAETLADTVFAMPPFGIDHARRCIDRLSLRPLLDGRRGAEPADVDGFATTAARFSTMVHALRDVLDEVDVNPVIVSASGCVAADALLFSSNKIGQ